jgi:hypothetical protein
LFLYTDLMCRMAFCVCQRLRVPCSGILSLFFTVNLTTKLFEKSGPTLHRNIYIKIRHTYIFDYKELKKIFEPKVKRRRNGAENMAYNKFRSCYSSHNNTRAVIQSTNDRMERRYTHRRYEHIILHFGRTAERNKYYTLRQLCVTCQG